MEGPKVRGASPTTNHSPTLQRTIGPGGLIVLGIGAIIGAGIFVATGIVAADHTGPAIILSFVLAAAACLCAGLCYAEFAAMIPVSGSAYSYVRAAFGEFSGWMIGWCLILEYLMAGAVIAVGCSAYFVAFLTSAGFTISPTFTSPIFTVSPSGSISLTGALVNAPTVILLTAITLISLRGVKTSIGVTTALVTLKLFVIGLFVLCGAFFVDTANWDPFLPANTGTFGEFGWSGVLRGAGVVFYAFLGFDAVSTAAREARNPQRSVPIGIVGSLLLATIIYMAFSLVLTGLAPYTMLNSASPASVALDHAGPQLHFLKAGVEIGAAVGLASSLMVVHYALSRIFYAIAQDGLAPSAFTIIGAKSGAPYISVIACGTLAAIAAGLLPVAILGQLISIGTLSAFVFVCGGVLYLRITQPERERPFRVPFAPFTTSAGMIICAYLMIGLPGTTWIVFLGWLAIGLALYLAFGRRNAIRIRAMASASAL